ncbi:MAG: bifunctional DNA-formamidopyrimidine glycosylase/DNA-(apurinic or apyrimidinic site) lyase [Dehalococcoidia bacterium]|nr:bifunctional DNA-formamidopyrimidine glycosylase/DNA-(apurinic or apyrimidinic site) lyase [Dehalococcoidia bacterium]
MPELPEVETIRNYLLPQVVGCRFTGVDLLWPELVRQPSPEEFYHRLAGQSIEDIRRRGKYLLFHLSEKERLILHLKMTGVLLLQPSPAVIEPHTRAILHLNNDADIHFQDRRKLGAMWLVEDEMTVVGKLGPEPLDDDFTADVLEQILHRHNIPIKALLFDQNIIAGIGNMYADEALFAAGINPLMRAEHLSEGETERLHQAIRQVLMAAIGHGGASVDTYQQPNGEPGVAQFFFQVAHRRGGRCYTCHAAIERITVRGRGTYFCPRCQGD